MAKPDNPAEAPVGARPPRPAQRGRPDASPRAGVAAGMAGAAIQPERRGVRELDDVFDTTRNLEAPEAFLAEDAFEGHGANVESEVNGENAFADDDLADDGAGHDDRAAGSSRIASADLRPGLAWVRRPAAPQPASGLEQDHASGARVPKLPLASLERPSTSRLELTPSPVPRVALAPATGAVDISLVPGPHTVGSRNLPTIAAQHLRARRVPRRPAPAVTLPPPAAAREARAAFTLARDVRSSKGEIVLGLTIGLGISLLLAGLGQAYLRNDTIADAPSAPARLESVTLSARPELAAAPAGAGNTASNAVPAGSGDGAIGRAPAQGASDGARANTVEPRATAAIGSVTRSSVTRSPVTLSPVTRSPATRSTEGALEGGSMLLARSAAAKRAEGSPSSRPQRAAGALAGSGVEAPAAPSPPVASLPTLDARSPQPPAASSPQPSAASPEPPAASTPLTPAESAGLGLDLPL